MAAKDITGHVAVVTGGSNGIGAATVRDLAAAGAKVVICYNQGEERARKLLAELPGSGHRIQQLKVEDAASVRKLAADVGAAYGGKVNILVNSAGYTRPVPHANLEGLTDELYDAVLTANVRGPFSIVRAFAPLLKASGDAVIINVSSAAAFSGTGSSIAYSSSKAALDTMTISLARVLGPEVRAIAISPGAVNTDFVPGRTHAALEHFAAGTPLKRICEPEDVARAIMGAITHFTYTTGVRIAVDGGSHIH